MTIDIKKFVTGPIETNTYVVAGEKRQCLIIDPSSGCDEVLGHIRLKKLEPAAILLTHAHFDHILGIPELQEKVACLPVWVHPDDRRLLTDAEYNGAFMIGSGFTYAGETLELSEGRLAIGDFVFTALHVPGHSPGGCAFVFVDNGETHCFAGDSLFAGSIGRYDLPGGDGRVLLDGIKSKLLTLPDATVVYPGHGGRTTIAREKRLNPFFT
jgi:hydroxyacylglutathione hydrolase